MAVIVRIGSEKYYVYGFKSGLYILSKKKKKGALNAIPEGYEVATTKTGRPYIKRKD